MKNITKKQIVTLVVLVMVLIMVIVGQYMVRPVLMKASDLNGKSENLEIKYENMQSQSLLFDVDNQDNLNFKDQISDEKDNLLPMMKNSELDKIVTQMVVSSGLIVSSLDIGHAEAFTVRIPYNPPADDKKDKSSQDNVDDNGADEKSQTAADPDAPPVLDPEKYPGAELTSDDFGNFYLEYKTGEYSCELCYNVTGKYENILKLVDKISENKAMSIGGISFENSEQLTEICQYKAVISVVVYMYDDQPDF